MITFIPQDHGRGHLFRCLEVARLISLQGGKVSFVLEKSLQQENIPFPCTSEIPYEGTVVVDSNDIHYTQEHFAKTGGARKIWLTDKQSPENLPEVTTVAPFATGSKSEKLITGMNLLIVPDSKGYEKKNIRSVKNIGIYFGALDETNNLFYTLYMLEQLELLDKYNYNILVGSQYKFKPFIDEHFEGKTKLNFNYYYSNFESIYEFISMNDMLIACCNNTAFEALHLGVPVLSFVQNTIQLKNAQVLQERHGMPNLGFYPPLNVFKSFFESDFINKIETFSKEAKQIIDGHGASRIARVITQGD